MHFLALLLGGLAVRQMTDYPSEIRNLKSQLPDSDRDAVLGQYKKLPNGAKASFKEALRNADVTAASQILGQDLSKYHLVLKKAGETDSDGATLPQAQSNIIDRVNKILAVPTSIDPDLYAEAAKRYAEAVPANSNMSIGDKTKRLLEVSG
ncbi:MAG: hypothetical protein P4N41_02645 [Negativicutes bacterium]|nr:hypothetical protein [Negativicutes bacterium]